MDKCRNNWYVRGSPNELKVFQKRIKIRFCLIDSFLAVPTHLYIGIVKRCNFDALPFVTAELGVLYGIYSVGGMALD